MLSFGFPHDGATVVIGGTGGIGRSICTRLAEAGANVGFTYRKNTNVAKQVGDTIRTSGRMVDQVTAEVTDRGSIQACFERFQERFGSIHSVVYTAAPEIPQQWMSAIEPAELERVLAINVVGLFHVMRAAIPLLRGGGSFVAVTSSAVHRYPRRDSLSAIPKSAVEMLMKVAAKEEGRYGMRANCVAPHLIETGGGTRMVHQVSDAVVAQMKRDIPLQRFGQPREVADAVVFLASPLSSFINGQVLGVDGGWQV